MADNTFYYLVQWEDRFMSVIQKKDIIGPLSSTDSTEFTEGDLIKAKYNGRTYEAVISEIHPNKKYLLQQTKLPPKHFYDSVKKANGTTLLKPPTVSASYDQPAVTPEVAVSATAKEITVSSEVAVSATAKEVTATLLKPPTVSASYDQPAVTPEVAVSATAKEITVSSEVAGSATAKEVAGSNIPSAASKRKTEKDRLEELKEDNRSLRKKLRRLEDRIEKLENQPKSTESSEDDIYNKMVEHLSASDVLRVLNTLARSIFNEEELTNCSRTGKKTVKCEGQPRPPLNATKLGQLERLVMQKTNITREVFYKKLENLQKTLRQKKQK